MLTKEDAKRMTEEVLKTRREARLHEAEKYYEEIIKPSITEKINEGSFSKEIDSIPVDISTDLIMDIVKKFNFTVYRKGCNGLTIRWD
jgi:hypothetical protein